MLIQMQMSDALAANLMTIEAIRAWVSASVLNPAAVFDPDPLVGLPTVPTAAGMQGNTSNSSSSNDNAGSLSDADSCWGRSSFVRVGGSSSSRSSSNSSPAGCSLVDWSSTCIGAPCSPVCSSSSSSSSNSSNNSGVSCPQGNRPAGKLDDSNSSSSSGLTLTRHQPKYCSRLNNALIVGLSPYQLFPSFGLPGVFSNSNSSSSSNAVQLLNEEANKGDSSNGNSKDSSSSNSNGNRRRTRRALSQSSSSDDSSGSSNGESATSATSPTSATSATSATSPTSSTSGTSSSHSSSDSSPDQNSNPAAPASPPAYVLQQASPEPPPQPPESPAHSPTTPSSPSQMDTKDTAAASSSNSSSSDATDGGSKESIGSSDSNRDSGSKQGTGGSSASSNGGSSGSTSSTSSTSSNSSAPKPEDLMFLPVTQLAKLLAGGTVTSQQLVAAFKERLQQYDSTLHAAVTITSQLADNQAAAAQQALTAAAAAAAAAAGPATAANNAVSLLSGVPYGLKDLFAVLGYPTTWGLSALRNRTIDTPSWAYSALSGPAGGVLLAKTATGELAWGDTWFDTITTRNPWNTDTGSCGSSAGSAAAVAAGLLPYAIGSETWGSIVCPATTVGVSAFRPTGGTIPTNGLLQVSPTLDKTGIFCRQLLDCAVVADALMDIQASSPTGDLGCCGSNTSTPRLHQQTAAQAAAFNYTAFQQQQLAGGNTTTSAQAAGVTGSVFPATFQELPLLSGLCIGYLPGTSRKLLSVLKLLAPACLKGPLPTPGDPHMVRDVLPTIMQAEVAISYEGLWLEGFIDQRNHWWPSIQLGQLAPAATYLRAQQLRALLLQQTRQYFGHYGIHVLLKPARSSVGLDGLAALVDMPEALLPVELGRTTFEDADPIPSGSTDGGSSTGSTTDASSQGGGSTGNDSSNQTWTQPKVNAIIALPGEDAAVIAVAAAFQSVTDVHLQRPPLRTAAGSSSDAKVTKG